MYLSAANQQIDNWRGSDNTATQAKSYSHFNIFSQEFCFSTLETYGVFSYKILGKSK
jgi:hypothetical protein